MKNRDEFLSTSFDIELADYWNEMMNVYKISFSDLNNLPFVVYQAKKNRPILLSMSVSDEADFDVQTADNLGAQMIEKHFMLGKTLTGNHHYHAMDERDAARIIEVMEYIDTIRGMVILSVCRMSGLWELTPADRWLVAVILRREQ